MNHSNGFHRPGFPALEASDDPIDSSNQSVTECEHSTQSDRISENKPRKSSSNERLSSFLIKDILQGAGDNNSRAVTENNTVFSDFRQDGNLCSADDGDSTSEGRAPSVSCDSEFSRGKCLHKIKL